MSAHAVAMIAKLEAWATVAPSPEARAELLRQAEVYRRTLARVEPMTPEERRERERECRERLSYGMGGGFTND